MLLKTVLSKTLRRKQDASAVASPDDSVSNSSSSETSPGSETTEGRNFSYAEASTLTKLLMEQSRRSKSGFFRQEASRRPKMRKAHSDADLLSGIEAPTTTPDALFLSRCHSISTTATEEGTSKERCIRLESEMSSLSLTETFSTTPEVKAGQRVSEGRDEAQHEEGGEPLIMASSKQGRQPITRPATLPRNYSFSFGSNVANAKRWTRDIFQDLKRPLNKEKKRKGKQAASSSTTFPPISYTPQPRKRDLEQVFKKPSTSDCLRDFQLLGGEQAPKRFSKETVKSLEKFDKEEMRVKKELARIEREREILLRTAEMEEQDGGDDEEIKIGGSKRKERRTIGWKKKEERSSVKNEKHIGVQVVKMQFL